MFVVLSHFGSPVWTGKAGSKGVGELEGKQGGEVRVEFRRTALERGRDGA